MFETNFKIQNFTAIIKRVNRPDIKLLVQKTRLEKEN